MVVVGASSSDEEQASSAGKGRRGGLVSRRVEMYEAPPKRGYRPRDEARDAGSVTTSMSYVGSTLIEAGVKHYAEGEYGKARKAFTTALKTQRVSVGEDDLSIALTLGNLGAVYLQQGDLEEAEKVLLESLLMKRRLKPNLIVADTLNNLGNCANLRGDLDQSLEYYREALGDLRRKRGSKADLANALFNLGRLEIQQDELDMAMEMLNECYKLTRQLYGPHHVFVAQTLDLIGFIQLSKNDYDGAMISYTKALGIFRRLYGPLHEDVANSLFNVGMVREAKGEYGDAWESYSTTRDLYQRLGTDSDHPGFKTVRQSITKVEKLIQQENQQRLVAKHTQAKGAKPRRQYVTI